MFRQEQRQRRRSSASRGVLIVAASVLVVAPLGFVALPGAAKPSSSDADVTVARRQLLASVGAAALLAAAPGPEAARAEVVEQSSSTSGVRNNPVGQRPEVNLQEEVKKRGTNLGRLINLRGACVKAPPEGFTATLSPGRIIVWDPDQPCGEGKSFIHAAGRGNGFAPMSSPEGPTVHVYKAANFDSDDILDTYKAQIGKCFDTPKGGADEIQWEIASETRGGKC